MRTKLFPAAVGLLALVAGGLAQAGDAKPYFEARQDRQMHRIVKGAKDGSLTPNESLELRRQQRHLYRARHKYLADGRLNKHERRILERKFDRASKRIRHLKHNDHHGYPDTSLQRVGHRHDRHGKHGHKYGGHRHGGHKHRGHKRHGHKGHGHKRHDYRHRGPKHYGYRDHYRPRYYGSHRRGYGGRHYDHYDDFRWWFGFGLWN